MDKKTRHKISKNLKTCILEQCRSAVELHTSGAWEVDAILCLTLNGEDCPLVVKIHQTLENFGFDASESKHSVPQSLLAGLNKSVAGPGGILVSDSIPYKSVGKPSPSENRPTMKKTCSAGSSGQSARHEDDTSSLHEREVYTVPSTERRTTYHFVIMENDPVKKLPDCKLATRRLSDQKLQKHKIVATEDQTVHLKKARNQDPRGVVNKTLLESHKNSSLDTSSSDPINVSFRKSTTETLHKIEASDSDEECASISEKYLGQATLNTFLKRELVCYVCKKEFEMFKDLKKHNWESHCLYTCLKCWNVFSQLHMFNNHTETCSDSKHVPSKTRQNNFGATNVLTTKRREDSLQLLPNNLLGQILQSEHSVMDQAQALHTVKENTH